MMLRHALALPLMLALGATAVPAQEAPAVAAAAAALKAASGEALLQAAYATCLELGGQGDNGAAQAFALAGWDVGADEEMGFSEIAGPEDLFALTWHDGDFCLVQSETVGSDRAAALVQEVFAKSATAAALQRTVVDGCLSFVPGEGDTTVTLSVDVTSSGNDPTCSSATDSGVSFMWGSGE